MSNPESLDTAADALYVLAARFTTEPPSQRAYTRLQETIFGPDCNLSAYRFYLTDAWHAAVLGEQPPEMVDHQLRLILAAGEPTTLPADVLLFLLGRRIQVVEQGRRPQRHIFRDPLF